MHFLPLSKLHTAIPRMAAASCQVRGETRQFRPRGEGCPHRRRDAQDPPQAAQKVGRRKDGLRLTCHVPPKARCEQPLGRTARLRRWLAGRAAVCNPPPVSNSRRAILNRQKKTRGIAQLVLQFTRICRCLEWPLFISSHLSTLSPV